MGTMKKSPSLGNAKRPQRTRTGGEVRGSIWPHLFVWPLWYCLFGLLLVFVTLGGPLAVFDVSARFWCSSVDPWFFISNENFTCWFLHGLSWFHGEFPLEDPQFRTLNLGEASWTH